MTVFEMLPEVIRSKELLMLIAFPILVYYDEMFRALRPIWLGTIGKDFATIATDIR